MRRLLLFLLFTISLSLGEDISKLKDFFNRQGYVVERLNGKVILDLGKESVRVGEIFKVIKEGKEIVHPVTGEVLGKMDEEVGKVRISEVKDKFSLAEILEDKGISKGDRVKLDYGSVCYSGSEEGYFMVSSLVGEVRKEEGCDYAVKEFEGGFGVEFKGMAVAFFGKPKPSLARTVTSKGNRFELSAELVLSFPSLPLSADLCSFYGREKGYLAVLFENELKIYEILGEGVVDYASVRLPAGYPVSVQCAPLEEGGDLVLVNIVSGEGMSSALIRVVGGSPVVVRERIPYFLSVLDKSRPAETFVGQKFDSDGLWGEVKRLRLVGDEVVEEGEFKVPPGFRADSALMIGNLLAFTDSEGYLRVFEGGKLILSEKGFGGSYTTADLPETYEDESKYTFDPKPFVLEVGGRKLLGVIKNLTSPVYRFLDVTKFSGGEVYLLTKSGSDVELRKVKGEKFEEALQAVVGAGEGELFMLTGRTGTLPLQNRGDLFRAKVILF